MTFPVIRFVPGVYPRGVEVSVPWFHIPGMTRSDATKTALLGQARERFWARGYSNVSLREIAQAAGVDVALVSRYFGSKAGLFEATLADLPALDPNAIPDAEALIATLVARFATPRSAVPTPSPVAMILMNAGDPEVGTLVRRVFAETWQHPLETILGDEGDAALFTAALMGISVAEKTLRLDGIAPSSTEAYRKQLRRILEGAIGGGPS